MPRKNSRPNRISPVTVIACLALVLSVLPIELRSQRNRFEDVTDVVLVEIPIRVVRDGKPVRGLTAADFEILDGRKKLQIVDFETIDLQTVGTAPEQTQATQVPISSRRHFLMLFDLSFSDAAAVVRAREAARDLVLEGLHPADVVAVGTYSRNRGARLVLGFTSDRAQVEFALETLGLVSPNDAVRDPLGIVVADLANFAPSTGTGGSGRGFLPNISAELTSYLADNERNISAKIEQNDILAMTTALGNMAEMMAGVQGSKQVVFLSEGFDSSLLLGTQDLARIQEINQASERGEVWNINSDERLGDTVAQGQLNDMVSAFRQADCTIQAVDIAGLAAGGDVQSSRNRQDGLFLMANETGGELYRNYNDLSDAMGEVLERTSVTYLAAVQPQGLKFDGKFHRLKIRLKNGKGRVIHRPGYYAPKPFSAQNPLEQRLSAAGLILGGTDGGKISSSVLAAPFPAAETAYVPVLLEIDGDSLIGGSKESSLPVEIYGYALDSTGTIRDFFSQAMALDLNKVRPALEHSGFKFWGDFDLPPGRYVLRVLVRNRLSGDTGLRVVPLTVPEFGSDQVALLPPLFPEPQGKWLMGREKRKPEQPDVEYPFILGGQAFVPAAKPVLETGAAVEFSLIGYNLGETGVSISSQLRGPDGSEVSGGELSVGSRHRTGAPGGQQMTMTYTPPRLQAGEYELEVTVSNSESGNSSSTSIPIVVGG